MHPSLPMKQWIPGGTERLTQPVIGAGASLSVAMPAWMVTNHWAPPRRSSPRHSPASSRQL